MFFCPWDRLLCNSRSFYGKAVTCFPLGHIKCAQKLFPGLRSTSSMQCTLQVELQRPPVTLWSPDSNKQRPCNLATVTPKEVRYCWYININLYIYIYLSLSLLYIKYTIHNYTTLADIFNRKEVHYQQELKNCTKREKLPPASPCSSAPGLSPSASGFHIKSLEFGSSRYTKNGMCSTKSWVARV